MTEVCVRVSWEVTRACQVHLPLDDLFSPITKASSAKASEGNGKDSLLLVESAIKCCKEWRTCYVEVTCLATLMPLIPHHHYVSTSISTLPFMITITNVTLSCLYYLHVYVFSVLCCFHAHLSY